MKTPLGVTLNAVLDGLRASRLTEPGGPAYKVAMMQRELIVSKRTAGAAL